MHINNAYTVNNNILGERKSECSCVVTTSSSASSLGLQGLLVNF